MIFLQITKAIKIYLNRRDEQTRILSSLNDTFPHFTNRGIITVEDCEYLSNDEIIKYRNLTKKIIELDNDFSDSVGFIKENFFSIFGLKSSNKLKDFINKWTDPGPGWRQI